MALEVVCFSPDVFGNAYVSKAKYKPQLTWLYFKIRKGSMNECILGLFCLFSPCGSCRLPAHDVRAVELSELDYLEQNCPIMTVVKKKACK